MSLGAYLVGLVFLVGILAAAATVSWLIVARRLGSLGGPARAVAYGLCFLAALIGFHLVPGAIGILSRESVLATAAIVTAACFFGIRPAVGGHREAPAMAASSRAEWAIALGAVALIAVYLTAALIRIAPEAPMHTDATSFALPGVAEWIRSGSLFETGSFIPLFQIRTYPNNGDVVALAVILPWRNDAFLRFSEVPLLAMLGLAVYAAARELRAPAALALLVACALVSMRVVSYPAFNQVKPDAFMYASFAAGGLFLLRHGRTGARSDLVLAGLGLGLAFGSRWYGLSSVAIAIVVWAVGLLVARRPARGVVRDGLVLVGVTLLAGGFWLVRNLALTGNPLYPIKVQLLGVTLFDAPRDIVTQSIGFSIADHATDWSVWRHSILPDYRDALGLPGLAVLVGSAVAAVLAGAELARRRRHRVVAVLAAAALLAVAYAVTPGSAQGLRSMPLPGLVGGNSRWAVPAMLAMAFATAWAVGRLRRVALPAAVLLFVAVIGGIDDTYRAHFPDDVPPGGRELLRGTLALVALLVLAAAVVWLGRRSVRRARALTALALALILGLAVGWGQHHQRRYNDNRYAGLGPVAEWLRWHLPEGSRVGFAGDWQAGYVPIYEAFGPRYDNQVEYAGPLRRGQLQQYHDRAAFQAGLRRGRYDVLVVGLLQEVDFTKLATSTRRRTLRVPPEESWAAGAGYREVARDDRYVVMTRASWTRRSTGPRSILLRDIAVASRGVEGHGPAKPRQPSSR